nr:ATP-dependent DNA helicase 2 subunit KU80 isoform X3 [Quercus suber]
MARNKETLLLLLDVGPSMHSVLPEVEKVCSLLAGKKLIYSKYDEVGVILFGTEDTKNELTKEVGGYQHVVVLRDTKVVDGDLVEALQQLPRGTHDGDFLDAIIVGMDILIKKFGETDKKKKRICLITNALCPIKESFEGTKEDQVITIAEQMAKHGMGMESIVVRGRLAGDANKRIMEENDVLLNIFSQKTCAKLVYVESPISLFGALRTRNISPVTIFRGDLELSSKMKIKPDSFYFNVLPFAEDVREFQFPSFNNFPLSWQPNEQQQEAADNLVKMLDLAPSGKEEALQPNFTPNPVLERFYRYLELKSKHPDAAVPPLDETLKKMTEPDPEVLSQNKSVIDTFRRNFELKENPKLKKSTRRFLLEKPSGSKEGEGCGNIAAQSVDSIKDTSVIKVENIGNLTPVQDFENMMSRRDGPEWIGKAIKDMKKRIFDLVEDSFEGDNYPKALECLVALRKGCILEQEPKHFNDFLHHLCKFCQKNNLNCFCEFLASKELTLISKTEAIDSEVTDDEARSFLVKSESKTE